MYSTELPQAQSISNVSTVRLEDAQSEASRNLETTSLPGNIPAAPALGGGGTAEVVNSIVDDLLDEAVKGGADTVSVGSETPNLRRFFRDGIQSEAHTPTSEHGPILDTSKVGVPRSLNIGTTGNWLYRVGFNSPPIFVSVLPFTAAQRRFTGPCLASAYTAVFAGVRCRKGAVRIAVDQEYRGRITPGGSVADGDHLHLSWRNCEEGPHR